MKRLKTILLLFVSVFAALLMIFSSQALDDFQEKNVALGVLADPSDKGGLEYPLEGVGVKYLTDGYKLVTVDPNKPGQFWTSVWSSSYYSTNVVDITVDLNLGAKYDISKFALYPRGNDGKFFPEDYEILVSDDKVEWTKAVTVTGDLSLDKVGRFHTVENSGTYVRLHITKTFRNKASRGFIVQISEFEVYAKVKAPAVFTIDKEEIWLDIGETDKIVPKMTNGSDATFTFSSSDTSILECSADGTLTAKGYGDATVSVTEKESGKTKSCIVKVLDKAYENIMIIAPMWTDKYANERQIGLLYDAGVDAVTKHHNLGTKYATDDTGIEDVNKIIEASRFTWKDGKNGMKVMILTGELENVLVNATDEQVMKFINKYKNYPMLYGFHVKDEPYDLNPYARLVRLINENSSGNAMINFFPGGVYPSYTDYLDRITDYAVLLGDSRSDTAISMDNYPFVWNSRAVDEESLFSNLNTLRIAGLKTGTNTGYYVQGTGYKDSYRRPTASDLTYHFSTGMAYGYKAVQYYTWFVPNSRPDDDVIYTDAIIGKDGEPTDLYPVAKSIHTKIHNLGTTLVNVDAVEVYHSGNASKAKSYSLIPKEFAVQPVDDEYAIVSLMVHRNTGRNYIMLVNKDLESSQTLDFRFNGISFVYLMDDTKSDGSMKKITLDNGKLSVQLPAGDFALYALPEGVDLTEIKDEESDNILQNKIPTDASSSTGANGWFLNKLTDGITVSTATSNGWKPLGESATAVYDLNTVKTFNRLDIYPAGNKSACGASFPTSVTILTSDDGVNYTECANFKNIARPTFNAPSFDFTAVTARYVKFVFGGSSLTGLEICELALYNDAGTISQGKTDYANPTYNLDDNLALGKPVHSSEIGWCSEAEGTGLIYLTDGYKMYKTHPKTGEYWTSVWPSDYHKERNETCWVMVDLGASYYFNRVSLYPRGTDGRFFPEDYEIQVSDDGENWNTVLTVTGDTSTEIKGRDHTFDEVQSRYVRVMILKHFAQAAGKGYTTQLSELEVFASRTVEEEAPVTDVPETEVPNPATKDSALLFILSIITGIILAPLAIRYIPKKRYS